MLQRPGENMPWQCTCRAQICSNMKIQMQTLLHLQTTFVQQDSIVLKLFVPLVVLLLPEQSLQNQNHQQTF